MIKIRSFLFKVSLITWWIAYYVFCCPVALCKSETVVRGVQMWGRFSVTFLLRWIGGIKTRVTGAENIPKGAVIIASKHQSELETLVLGYYFPKPVFVLKKELVDMPFFGWFVKKSGMIAVDRKAGGSLQQMLDKAIPALKDGSQMVIFPEGTRVQNGKYLKFKQGVGMLYVQSNVPVVPVAVNSGLFWSGGKLHRTGTIDVVFMEPIQPGLPLEEFMEKLEKTILTKSEELNQKVLN